MIYHILQAIARIAAKARTSLLPTKIVVFGLVVVACSSLSFVGTPVKAEDVTVSIGVGDTVLTVTGRTSPGAFVTILDDGTTIGTTTADSNGDFSQTFTAFVPGVHKITVYARDTADRITSPVEKEISATEHFETTVDLFLPTTLTIDNATVPTNTPITMQGSTIPGGKVIILVNDDARTVAANSSGDWTYVLDTAGMAAGNHTVYAVVNDPVTAEQSYPTAKVLITLIAPQSGTPFLPPFIQPVKPDVPVIIYPTNGSTVEGNELDVRGTAQPGTRIELYSGSLIIGSTFTNSRGEWKITITLNDPSYTIRARACRLLVCSDFSQSVNFFWQSFGMPGQGLFIYLEQYWFLIGKGKSITHNLHISGGVSPYTVLIDWGNGSTDTLNGKDLHLTLTHKYPKTGQFVGTVTVTDKDGVVAKRTFAVEVTAPFSSYLWLVLFLIILLSILLLLITYHLRHKKKGNK